MLDEVPRIVKSRSLGRLARGGRGKAGSLDGTAPRRRRGPHVLAVVLALSGCIHGPKWTADREVKTDDIARVLDEPAAVERPISPSEVPDIPVRMNLRPCCAFGTKLRASLGPI